MAKKRPLKKSEKDALDASGSCDCGGALNMKGDSFKCNRCGKTYDIPWGDLSADNSQIIEEDE